MTWMGWRDELAAIGWGFIPHEGNSHTEKALLYGVIIVGLVLVVLRSVGLATFEDPHVARFVEGFLDLLKVGGGFIAGSVHKGERAHRTKTKAPRP